MCPAVWHSVCPYVQRRSRFFFFFFFLSAARARSYVSCAPCICMYFDTHELGRTQRISTDRVKLNPLGSSVSRRKLLHVLVRALYCSAILRECEDDP
jgi:hypothetical protein